MYISMVIKFLLTAALLYLSSPKILFREITLGLEWGSNPHPHISSVMLYQLSYQALAIVSKAVGRKGIQMLVLGAHSIKSTSS